MKRDSTLAALDSLAVPTKVLGELYIPALGKVFQQVELRSTALEVSSDALRRGGGGAWRPQLVQCGPGTITARLCAGTEMAVSRLLLLGPAAPGEKSVIVRIGSLELCALAPQFLRAHSTQHVDHGRLAQLLEAVPVGPLSAESLGDMLVGVQALVQRVSELPQLGFCLHVPAQVTDIDDVGVENLPPGNALFLVGLLKIPYVRAR